MIPHNGSLMQSAKQVLWWGEVWVIAANSIIIYSFLCFFSSRVLFGWWPGVWWGERKGKQKKQGKEIHRTGYSCTHVHMHFKRTHVTCINTHMHPFMWNCTVAVVLVMNYSAWCFQNSERDKHPGGDTWTSAGPPEAHRLPQPKPRTVAGHWRGWQVTLVLRCECMLALWLLCILECRVCAVL